VGDTNLIFSQNDNRPFLCCKCVFMHLIFFLKQLLEHTLCYPPVNTLTDLTPGRIGYSHLGKMFRNRFKTINHK